MKRVVIVGAGFGGLACVRLLSAWQDLFDITLLSEDSFFTFTPLLGEVATGLLLPEDVQEPLAGAFSRSIHVVQDRVARIDTQKRVVQGKKDYPYDYLLIASGSQTDFHDIPGAWRYALPLKTVEDAVAVRDRILSQFRTAVNEPDEAVRSMLTRVVVVGGGATGVTIAAEMGEFLRRLSNGIPKGQFPLSPRVVLLCRGPELLSGFPEWMRRRSADFLAKGGVEVQFHVSVAQVHATTVVCTNTENLETSVVLWLAGVMPRSLAVHPSATCDTNGRLLVDQYLRLAQHEHEFAVGDVAGITDKTGAVVPSLAQAAEDAGECVAASIIRHAQRQPLLPFHYRQKGLVVTVGRFLAFGYILGIPVAGVAAWFGLRFFYAGKSIRWSTVVRRLWVWTRAAFRPRFRYVRE